VAELRPEPAVPEDGIETVRDNCSDLNVSDGNQVPLFRISPKSKGDRLRKALNEDGGGRRMRERQSRDMLKQVRRPRNKVCRQDRSFVMEPHLGTSSIEPWLAEVGL
jgi:hypothetical protein